MGKPKKLINPKKILIAFEERQIEKIEKRRGNRTKSQYIRDLVNNELIEMEKEEQNLKEEIRKKEKELEETANEIKKLEEKLITLNLQKEWILKK